MPYHDFPKYLSDMCLHTVYGMQAMLVVLHVSATIAIMSIILLFLVNGKTVIVITTNRNNMKGTDNIPFQGVNMAGHYTTVAEFRDSGKQAPINYYNDSFKIFSEAGLNIVRYLFTWESYEKNPHLFIAELLNISKTADKWGLKIVYANDQFHISSWLDPKSGYGFPSFLFTSNKDRFPFSGGGSSETELARLWWTDWYNRTVTDSDNRDGWKLQADFLKNVASAVDSHASTLGYEILNEPQVYSKDQWTKIGSYNTFIASQLRQVTNKTIFFDRQLPSDIGGVIAAFPENMAMMGPRNIGNTIFKTTLYGLPTHCSYAEARLSTAVRAAQLMRVPLWIGEFNIGITPQNPIANINQTELNLFVNKFHEVDAWGWSLWLWSFNRHPQNVRNYDLAIDTRDNRTGVQTIQPTKYFDYLKQSAIIDPRLNISSPPTQSGNFGVKKEPKGAGAFNNQADTICPVVQVASIDDTAKKTNLFISTSPAEPLQLNVVRLPSKLLIQGETYDIGSGLASVQIKLEMSFQKYQSVLLSTLNGASNWSALIDVNDIGRNKLIVRAVDKAGNVSYNTIFLNVTRQDKNPSDLN